MPPQTTAKLSLSGKRWELPRENSARHPALIIAGLFASRGIDPDAPLSLVPPSVFPDMTRAAERIRKAIANGERIGIFGDYDCDGITAVAQLVRFFRRNGAEPVVRLPHRVRDGYGLSPAIAREWIAAGVTLLITADTGIGSVRETALLAENGIDVIVTDHHHMGEELPPAYAIVHPGLAPYPCPPPSGAGVVYKLIHALERNAWNGMEEDTALAMLGTIADLVELRGDNRTLAILGLRALNGLVSGPLAELRERCRSKDTTLGATDIAFRMAPRINAAGRMAEPDIALRALLEGGETLAVLDALNEERQEQTRMLVAYAMEETGRSSSRAILASVSGDYPHGIVGLIAGKLTEAFGKPSLVAHADGRTCTASLRSTKHYDITAGLARCSAFLTNFGGHAQAAGCTFAMKNFDALIAALDADIRAHVAEDLLVPTLCADAELEPRDVTLGFCAQLAHLRPFGQGNPEPLFLIRNTALDNRRSCGAEGAHLQARIGGVKSIGFGMATFASESEKFDVLVRCGTDEWNGKTVPQFFIEDLAEASPL